MQRTTARPPRRALRASAALLLPATALILASCAAPATSDADATGDPVAGGDITFARLSSPVTSLDPHDDTLITINAYTLDKVFDTLYALDEEGEPQPSLATSYEVSDDGLTWTFSLRDGVVFSDGSAFDAADVVYSIGRHLDLGGALPLGAPIIGVTAVDDHTVEIVLSEPYTPLLSELSVFSSSILPEDLAGLDEDEFFADPIGTGPFTVEEWDPSSTELTLARNDEYWVEGLPYLDTVRLTTVDDDNQLVQQVQSGQADIVDDVPIANVEELEANGDVRVQSVGSWNQDIVFFNTTSDVFSDRGVRRAVVQAVDRDALTEATTFGTGTPARTFIASTIRYSDQDVDALEYDVDAAKDELAASEHPEGAAATLLVEGGSQSRAQQAQIIQASLAEIGVDVEIETVDSATFWTRFPAGDYEFALSTTIADTGDPDNVSSWQVDGDGVTQAFYTYYDNDEVDALVKEGRITPDGDERAAIYSQIQEIVAQDSPSLSLDYVSEIKAAGAHVHGLQLIPNGTVRLENVWIDPQS
ncbi:ABC transporter substrate-binding protein [Microbacterium betulae]|uniref:ABC transporter substrate-binding protein n=1 Tax=Microbacterium betulae TaxID=2981139 RepID=A0AA97FL72_9MICO|nr:ABC transporter substrate-binding protein [Microbacterium sp. AB]WOF23482.1 ABC transporter substrate-binding protein [Microbacterium sp. AB]